MTNLRVPDLAAMKKRDVTMARIFDRVGVDIAARIRALRRGRQTSPAPRTHRDRHPTFALCRRHPCADDRAHAQRPAEIVLWQEGQLPWDSVTARKGDPEIPVRPDAYFVLRQIARPDGRSHVHVFLEADRSTMAHSRMAAKIAGYLAYYEQGRISWHAGIHRSHADADAIPRGRTPEGVASPDPARRQPAKHTRASWATLRRPSICRR